MDVYFDFVTEILLLCCTYYVTEFVLEFAVKETATSIQIVTETYLFAGRLKRHFSYARTTGEFTGAT